MSIVAIIPAINVAWCDSQDGTLVALAKKVNIRGGWVGLYGCDEASHHSASALHWSVDSITDDLRQEYLEHHKDRPNEDTENFMLK
jgi:hypothetical protein